MELGIEGGLVCGVVARGSSVRADDKGGFFGGEGELLIRIGTPGVCGTGRGSGT